MSVTATNANLCRVRMLGLPTRPAGSTEYTPQLVPVRPVPPKGMVQDA